MSKILLHAGGTPRRAPGFIDVGLEPGGGLHWSVERGLPFPDASIQVLVIDHALERLPHSDAISLLRECRRVLSPVGVLRIATQDLDAAVEHYRRDSWRDLPWLRERGLEWVQSRAEFLNVISHGAGHRWLYDREELERLTRFVGLVPSPRSGNDSMPDLARVELAADALVMEFARPARPPAGADAPPLVSILIPAYRPTFMQECLESALAQTYSNLEILISDDCRSEAVHEVVAPYLRDPRVRYWKNRGRGGIESIFGLMESTTGEYVKFLFDDDRLHPRCVERMVEAFGACPDATLVTSRRQMIDTEGNFLPDSNATAPAVAVDSVIKGVEAVDRVLSLRLNYIGEMTTAMFRTADARHLRPDIFCVGGFPTRFNQDVGLWVNLLSQGDLVYLVDTLSFFRRHGDQSGAQGEIVRGCIAEWDPIVYHSRRMGFLAAGAVTTLNPLPLAGAEAGAAAPREATPLVSIVIPVFNKWSYTAKCLEQLARNTTGYGYEVIVVDNASSDETQAELARLEGQVRVHRNETNLGFSRACNQGARMARGKYLLFLNNDTEPLPGWLEPLVRILDEEPEVSLVGSKLLFPDGTLQHAGVHIGVSVPFPLTPFHLDYRQPADRATGRRELQAVTGACFLIRSEVFAALDGFDEAYINGCEDIDLCLKVRQAGGRVVFTAESVLIHHESVSDGRFLYVSKNMALFHERWMHLYPGLSRLAAAQPLRQAPTRPGISVLVVTRNSLTTVAPCLESLATSCGPQDEIILVDDASEDGTHRFLEMFKHQLPARVRGIRNPDEQGYARSVNLGLRSATTDYVLLLQPDAVLTPGCVERMLGVLERDPATAAVGPLTDRVEGSQKASLTPEQMAFDRGEAVAADLAERNVGLSRTTRLLQDFCLLVRRERLEQVGGLDEQLLPGTHDLDLSLRLRDTGGSLRIAEDAFVRHWGHHAPRERNVVKREYLRRQGANLLYEKLYQRLAGRVPSAQDLWGSEVLQPQTGLTSVVVQVHDQLELTRQCLEALYQNTHRDLELILVDNGSREDVAGLAEELRARRGEVVYLRNEQNQGYAFGANQGLARARGEYVVLLDNDVIVTPGWLSRQLAVLALDPKVGMVGPRASNCARPQLVETGSYQDVGEMVRFAEAWFAENAGELSLAPRLMGLCMVMRRQVLERIGGFDTCFGIGGLESDDLCLRALRAGYMLAVAGDVFVHHYGSVTFRAREVDSERLLDENSLLFRSKWGISEDIRSGYPAEEIAAARAFDATLDRIPLGYDEVFSPAAAPLELGEARAVRLLCIPDWGDPAWAGVLISYLRTFGPEDPVSLILRVEPPLPGMVEAAFEAAQACVEASGVPEAQLPDVVFEASSIAPAARGGLYTAATALLRVAGSREALYAREARACGLPIVEAPDQRSLQAAVEGLLEVARAGV